MLSTSMLALATALTASQGDRCALSARWSRPAIATPAPAQAKFITPASDNQVDFGSYSTDEPTARQYLAIMRRTPGHMIVLDTRSGDCTAIKRLAALAEESFACTPDICWAYDLPALPHPPMLPPAPPAPAAPAKQDQGRRH